MVRDSISWTDCLFHHRSVELALLLNSRIENTMSWPSTFKSSQCGKSLAVFIEMSRQVSIKMSISSIYQNVAPVSIKMSRQVRINSKLSIVAFYVIRTFGFVTSHVQSQLKKCQGERIPKEKKKKALRYDPRFALWSVTGDLQAAIVAYCASMSHAAPKANTALLAGQ